MSPLKINSIFSSSVRCLLSFEFCNLLFSVNSSFNWYSNCFEFSTFSIADKQPTEDEMADLIIAEIGIKAEIKEVEQKAEIKAHEIIDKANAHRKKMLEQIQDLLNFFLYLIFYLVL